MLILIQTIQLLSPLVERLTSGQTKDVASVMLAAEKADIAFRAMNNVRSKVIEAYKEIMRMQV